MIEFKKRGTNTLPGDFWGFSLPPLEVGWTDISKEDKSMKLILNSLKKQKICTDYCFLLHRIGEQSIS